MSRDDFLDAAIEAGVVARDGCGYFVCSDDVDEILNLAALVAAREREACAQVALHYAKALDYGGNEYMRSHECQLAANAIRARGTP